MYCTEREVRQLIEALIRRLPAFDLFCEVFQADWLQGWRKRMVDYKLQQELGFGTDAQFTFGLHRSEDMEAWAPGLRLVSDWSYFDADHPALGPLRWFRHWPAFRYIQWSVYYHYERPGPKPAEDN